MNTIYAVHIGCRIPIGAKNKTVNEYEAFLAIYSLK